MRLWANCTFSISPVHKLLMFWNDTSNLIKVASQTLWVWYETFKGSELGNSLALCGNDWGIYSTFGTSRSLRKFWITGISSCTCKLHSLQNVLMLLQRHLFKCSQILSHGHMISNEFKKNYVNLRSTMDPSEFGSRSNISVLKINMSIPEFFPLETCCTLWRLHSQISPQMLNSHCSSSSL